jgi:hypothetical protein
MMKKQMRLCHAGKACILIFLFLSMLLTACKKDEGPATPPDPVPTIPLREYQAAAAIGDIFTIIVNENEHTISYNNKTTGESGVVAFTRVTGGMMKGALKVMIDGDDYYMLEIPGQLIMTYLPVNASDEMVVGVIRHDYTPGDHWGTWLFFGYDPDPDDDNYWGRAVIGSNGTFDLALWDFHGTTVHTESGNWWQDNMDPGIIYSHPYGSDDTIAETIYVLPEKLRVYDSGPQVGMGVGFAEPAQEITMNDIAGSYATLWSGGYGQFVIEANGTLTANFYVDGQLFEDILYDDFRRTTPSDAIHFNNTFFFTDHMMPGPIKDVYVILLPGDVFLGVYLDEDDGMRSSMAVRVDR